MPSIQNFDVQAVHTVPTVQYIPLTSLYRSTHSTIQYSTVQYIPLTSLYRSHYASVPHGEDGSSMVEMAV